MGHKDQERAEGIVRRANDLRGNAAQAAEILSRLEQAQSERTARRAGVTPLA